MAEKVRKGERAARGKKGSRGCSVDQCPEHTGPARGVGAGGPVFPIAVPVPKSLLSASRSPADSQDAASPAQSLDRHPRHFGRLSTGRAGPGREEVLSHWGPLPLQPCLALAPQMRGPRHRSGHTYAHARARAHTHARTHTSIHTHTPICPAHWWCPRPPGVTGGGRLPHGWP